jgi:hypothetical protein
MQLRDPPELPETMARMIQPEDIGELILFIARQPPHICLNEIVISPTHNRTYLSMMRARRQLAAETRQNKV